MPEFCTCGAELPPDARFCHKCGKPQREEPLLEPPEVVRQETPPPLDLPAIPVEISFHNSLAVRVGFLAGGFAFLLGFLLPMPFFGRMILLVGAGFFSVYLYRRRSGRTLSVRDGARMGWIAGLFCFLIITIFITITVGMIAYITRDSAMASSLQQQVEAMGVPKQAIEQAMEVFRNPWLVAEQLFFFFLLLTALLTAGGALGAKVLSKH